MERSGELQQGGVLVLQYLRCSAYREREAENETGGSGNR